MTKHTHDVGRGMKAVQHGGQQHIGPMSNARHPRKLKLSPIEKKPAPSAANTEGGGSLGGGGGRNGG